MWVIINLLFRRFNGYDLLGDVVNCIVFMGRVWDKKVVCLGKLVLKLVVGGLKFFIFWFFIL